MAEAPAMVGPRIRRRRGGKMHVATRWKPTLLMAALLVVLYTSAAPSQPIISQSPENGSGGLGGTEPTGPPRPTPRDAAGHPDLTGYWKPLREKGKPGGNLGKDLPGFQLPLTAAGKAAQDYNRTQTIDPEAL